MGAINAVWQYRVGNETTSMVQHGKIPKIFMLYALRSLWCADAMINTLPLDNVAASTHQYLLFVSTFEKAHCHWVNCWASIYKVVKLENSSKLLTHCPHWDHSTTEMMSDATTHWDTFFSPGRSMPRNRQHSRVKICQLWESENQLEFGWGL